MAVKPVSTKLWSNLKSATNTTWQKLKPSANALWSKLKSATNNPLVKGAWGLAKTLIPQLDLVDEGISAIDRVIQSDDIVGAVGKEARNAIGKVAGGLLGGSDGNPFMQSTNS